MTQTDREEHRADPSDGAGPANPLLAEVTRGAMVESRHRAAVAAVDPQGQVRLSVGDIERPVFARSAIKPLQAIPLLESGAAEAFSVSDAEIALACASHAGEPRHVEGVRAWLARIGCSERDLECGAHVPLADSAARALLLSGAEPGPAHNNCSGKHAGFLTLARHLEAPTKGYIDDVHAVQQRLLGLLEVLTGLDLGPAPRGIDGCGIPVIGIPLGNLARAMACFADPRDQPEARQAACARIRRAMAAEPGLVAGKGRFFTRFIEATHGAALVKTGAEGVVCGALPELGLGFALKVDDGANRAAQVITGRLLRRLGVVDETLAESLASLLEPPVVNRAGREVGRIRVPAGAPF
ncbi:MAG: asparaginase [Kiloniellaceae bacterium]